MSLEELDGSGPGAGSALNPVILITAGVATFVATVVAAYGVFLQLKVPAGFMNSMFTFLP